MVLPRLRALSNVSVLALAAGLFSCEAFVARAPRMPPSRPTAGAASAAASASDATVVPFAKYHGLGNDFILIDDRDRSDPRLSPAQAARLCHRNFGVGADGVVFALRPPAGDGDYDVAMRIYNSDGSEPEMCGNGIRCLGQFLRDRDGADPTATVTYNVHTLAGPIRPVLNADGATITVDMGEPILAAARVPTTLPPNADQDSVVEQTYDCGAKTWRITAVSMGNPHAVIFVDDLARDVDLPVDGPALEAAPVFPAKTNVEFVQVLAPTHLKMQVWERGAGPTLACGTGACALTVAAVRAGKIPRPADGTPVRVSLPGGDLLIEWRTADNHVYMTGPATFTFHGEARI